MILTHGLKIETRRRVKIKSRVIALKLGLSMKISDVEFQADGKKTIFHGNGSSRFQKTYC